VVRPRIKTRGADPRNFILKMPLKDLMLEKVLPEWRNGPREGPGSAYTLEIRITNYITAGAAAASDERFKLIGRWCDTKRTIDVHNLGVKRGLIDEFREFYFSGPPVKGAMNRKIIEKTARVLEAPFKDVAACYRSGEAMRCRFLVPSLPAKNPTPDALSIAAEPAWLNPDYDDEDAPWKVTEEEDQDTADVISGER
jgi:hypothetical protein